MSVEEKYNTPNSGCCGRPMQYATDPQCNYTDACMDEYCCPNSASIKETEPSCKNKAVIPSITVDSAEGITNLANCFVHVTDINTTFYVDDKHRIMITWAGPVDIPGYDMESNPEGFRDQIVTDVKNEIAVIYDKKGVGYTFGIKQGVDVTEAVNMKLDEMAEDGTLSRILEPLVDDVQDDLDKQIDALEDNVNAQLTTMNTKINQAVSGNPIPVSSISDMTNHNRTYLLTTDGYWYYWDGDSWERGGVYQATQVADFSINPQKTTFSKRSSNLLDVANPNILYAHPSSDLYMHPGSNVRSLYIECEASTTYTVIRHATTGRFGVCTSSVQPTDSSAIAQWTSNHTGTSITIATNSSAAYLIVYYWNSSASSNTEEEALNDLCIVKGVSTTFIPSYVIEVDTPNLNDGAVTPEKTSFTKDSSNLYNVDDSHTVNLYPSQGAIHESANAYAVYVPCDPNTNYVIKKILSSRFSVCGTAVLPANGVTATNIMANHSGTQIKYTTDATANYLLVYLYNANVDTVTLSQVLESLVIKEGTDDIETYIPYGKIIEVTTDNINDKAITPAKLSDSLRNIISMSGSLTSRNGIYGVSYDLTSTSSKCTRIGNAAGLQNDYVIDTEYVHGGHNDFDNIFPWCDIRRCNVKISSSGQKTITYEGETGFTLDGSNGDVMVEIPKFYSYRERIGNTETIAISGERKSGFVCEPAFVVNGKELEHIYVACYNQAETPYMGSNSYSGSFPICLTSLTQNITTLSASNMQSYDFTTYLMLQKLMIIEFGDRAVQQYLGGMTRLPYYIVGTTNAIDGFGPNYFTFQSNVGEGTMDSLWVGERIRVGGVGYNTTRARLITSITQSGTQFTVTYDGESYTDISVGDGVGCYGQRNGLCDNLTYHTGRTDFVPSSTIANYINPMRYRYIENVIGNVWEQVAGLRVKQLQPYFSFEPNVNSPVSSGLYETTSYKVPLQGNYPASNQGWVISQGYDQNNRLVNLPTSCGASGGYNKYFSGTFYSRDDDIEYIGVVGGGWDTYYWANINTLRAWSDTGNSVLYSNRPIYRG